MTGAIGRVALILTAGAFLGLAGAAQAAPSAASSSKPDSAGKSAESIKYSKHRRRYAHHSVSKTADKTSDDKAGKTEDALASDSAVPASDAMPTAVANANAQLAAADTATAAAAVAMSTRASDNVQAAAERPAPDSPVVASDQLNDADRTLLRDNALQDNTPAPKTVVADAQPRPAPVMASSSTDSSAWEQSSLIGKIFIGFGALLTLASAARMFMA